MADTENRDHAPEPHQPPVSDTEDAPAELSPENWQDSPELGWVEVSPRELRAYTATVRRIEWMIGIAGIVCAASVLWPLGWQLSIGVLLGAALAWINFRWLADSVNAIGERIVKAKSGERGAAVVARGIGRIFLIVLLACVIFTCSVRGLVGYLAGLATPVIALMCEAVYQIVASVRRSS